MRLEHANITVENVNRSIEFYRHALGLELRWEGEISSDDGEPLKAAHIGNKDYYLAFFEAEKQGKAPSNYESAGINHIAFVVDDLTEYRSRLNELNVKIHLEYDYEPGTRIYFFDPDGVEIELVEY